MSLYLTLKSRNYWSRHLTLSCSDQETAATALCRMLPTQEILFVKDSDMKAMISQVSVGKIQSLLFHRHRNRGSSLGARAPQDLACVPDHFFKWSGTQATQDFATNKDVSCILYVHICSYLICLGRVALQPKLFFQGALSSALFIFRKCCMASRTGAKLFLGVIEFLVRLFRTL